MAIGDLTEVEQLIAHSWVCTLVQLASERARTRCDGGCVCGVCAAYRMHPSIAARIVRIKATTACNRDRSSIYGHGTQGIITNIHYRPLGGVSHVDVRLLKGEFVREVPVNFFLA